MQDEASVLAKLDSQLFGALLQSAIVTSDVIRSDAVAARIVGGRDHVVADAAAGTGFVFVRGTTAPQSGPAIDDKLIEGIRGCQITDGVFLLKQKLDASVYTSSALVRTIESHGPIRDSLGLTCHAPDSAWCAIIHFRIGESPAFNDADVATLERLKPTITRRLHDAFNHRARGATVGGPSERLTYEQAISKLSRTEREVLGHLLEAGTERQIATKIHRSPHTVHVHVKNIYRKIRVNSRHELLAMLQR